MNLHERLSSRQRDNGISCGFMAAIIPFAASILLEQILLHARSGVLIEARHLASTKSEFNDQEIIPTDKATNSVIIPSGATAEVKIGTRTYIAHDFSPREALIKYGGKILRRVGKYRNDRYQMLEGKAVVLNRINNQHTFGDGTLAAWRP